MTAAELADIARSNFRANVRRIMAQRDLSQRQLGKAAVMTQSAVSDLLNGPGYPTLISICRICAALDVRPAAILISPSAR